MSHKRAAAFAFAAAAGISLLATPAFAGDDDNNEQNGVILIQDNMVCNSGDVAGAGLVAVTVPLGNDEELLCENFPN